MTDSGSYTSNPAGSPKLTDTTPAPTGRPEEYDRFENLAAKLVNVPKSEVDELRKDES